MIRNLYSKTTGEGAVVDYKYDFDGRKLQEKVTGPVYMFFLRDHLYGRKIMCHEVKVFRLLMYFVARKKLIDNIYC